MRENVISQLEEEIKGKERLIFEQSHLINILENEAATQTQLQAIRCDNNNKYDTVRRGNEELCFLFAILPSFFHTSVFFSVF